VGIVYPSHVKPTEIAQQLGMNVGMEVYQGHVILETVNMTQFWLLLIVVRTFLYKKMDLDDFIMYLLFFS
jgi:hypothetical protein